MAPLRPGHERGAERSHLSKQGPSAQYLARLSALLKVRLRTHRGCRRRILADIQEHLEDAADAYEAEGLERDEAERCAIADLGPAERLVGEFVPEVRRARRRTFGPAAALAAILVAFLVTFRLAASEPEPVPIAPLTPDCGSDDGGRSPPESDGAEGRRRVVVAGVWSGSEGEKFAKVLERFEKKTGVEAKFAYETRDIASTLNSRLSRGCPPDVALLPQPSVLADLARRGQLKPIEEVAGDLVDRNYAKDWRELGSSGGELYGVWFKAANKSSFWYRPAAFRKAGVEPPRTWGELKRVAGRISASGIAPFSVAGADGWTLTDWFENVYLGTAGPRLYERLAEHRIPWTDRSVRRALGRLSEIFGNEKWLAGEPAMTDFEESVRDVFADPPQAAMVYEGDFVAGALANVSKAKVGEGAESFDFPAIDGLKPAVVAGGDVAALFTDNAAAKELIRFLATPQAAEPWARSGGFVSPNENIDPRAYADAASQRAAAALEDRPVVFDLSDQQPPAFGVTEGQGMREILRNYLLSTVTGPADVDAVAQGLEDAVSAAETLSELSVASAEKRRRGVLRPRRRAVPIPRRGR
jgi:ABC-type glycerol-3-phosphate transport system substrate-binding protein